MKRIGFLAVTILMACTVLIAQENRKEGKRKIDPKERAEKMTERMVKEFSLNDVQKQQLYDVNLSMTEKMKEHPRMHPGKKGQKGGKEFHKKDGEKKEQRKDRPEMTKEQREQMRAQMMESRNAYNAKVKEIFTPEQYTAYEKKQAERQEKMKERKDKRDNKGKKMDK